MKADRFNHLILVLVAFLVGSLACDMPVEFISQGENLSATETLQALATREACALYNQLSQDKLVVAALHITC